MNAILQASNLSFRYTEKPVLADVSLALAPGEVVALLGPNGSGKTTLIRTLLGHLRAAGTIAWDGKSLEAWTHKDLARRVAYLPQSPTHEIGQTVLDVLRLGRAPYWRAFGIESTRDAEVVDRIAATLGLTDLLHRSMDLLSGGQRQRVFVGRCLVQEPAAMLLDEPNTFLDLRHQIDLGTLLRKLAHDEQIAVLMASHDLNLAGMFADRLMLLSEGRVVADGPPDAVLRPEILSRVYGLPMLRTEVGHNRKPLVYPADSTEIAS